MPGLRILVVDDDPMSRELLRIMLGRLQQTCQIAVDGAEALSAFAESPFDLVLLDRQLPDLDGLEVLRRLRGLPGGEAARVVVVSGDPGGDLPASVDGALAKPFSFEELALVVEPKGR